jgi:hypothetical protein
VLGVLGRKAAGVEAGVERSDVGILGGGAVFGAHGLKGYAELLIDCEKKRALRAVLVGMLRESRSPVEGSG